MRTLRLLVPVLILLIAGDGLAQSTANLSGAREEPSRGRWRPDRAGGTSMAPTGGAVAIARAGRKLAASGFPPF